MKVTRTLILLTLAVALAGCSGAKYNSDYAPQANFAAYETYAWYPGGNNLPDDRRYNNSMVDNRLKDAIGYALQAKGLREAGAQEADVLVVYHAIVDERTTYTTLNNYYAFNPYWSPYGAWGGWGGGYGSSTTYANDYEEGTVIVDLLENVAGDEDRLVWRGSVTDSLKSYNDPQKRREENRAVALQMFRDYPPGAGQ
jgi:hypothetical protein